MLDAKSARQCVFLSNLPLAFLADFDIVDPTDPLRAPPGGGPHPDYLLESPMSDGTIEEDFEAALARDGRTADADLQCGQFTATKGAMRWL